MCLATKHLNSLKRVIDEIHQDKQVLSELVSKADNEVNTLYHEIEIGNFNASAGYKKLKELQESLRKRRIVKHEYTRLQSALQSLSFDSIKARSANAEKNVEKLKIKNNEYTDGWNKNIEDFMISE